MEDRLKKMREERTAREEARIQKLREMNLKKYPKSELQSSASAILPVIEKNPKTGAIPKSTQQNSMKTAKSGTHVNCKRPITAPAPVKKPDYSNIKPKVMTKFTVSKSCVKVEAKTTDKVDSNIKATSKSEGKIPVPKTVSGNTSAPNVLSKPDVIITEAKESDARQEVSYNKKPDTKSIANNEDPPTSSVNEVFTKPDILMSTKNCDETDKFDDKVLTDITLKKTINTRLFPRNDVKLRKSLAAPVTNYAIDKPKINARKSMLPRLAEGTKSESVFERLYKPKIVAKKTEPKPEPEKKENTLRKAKSSDLMYNIHLNALLGKSLKPQAKFHQRRSISAVHFKRISKSEASNCIHKWGSIGDKLDQIDLKNDDEEIKEDKVVSAVKSERKKVQFMTPVYSNMNTPRPDELQARLKSWLQKRGKSLSSFHHLQCFGLHHLKSCLSTPRPMKFEDALDTPAPIYDEENKENIALESDSDDESISELTGKQKEPVSNGNTIDVTNWRNVSSTSESAYNDSFNTHKDHMNDLTLTPASSVNNIDELLYGALNDLSTLLREGFDWQQAARWLRSIRQQFPTATSMAAYWECRAALEDARGNLTASVECWKEAIAKGTEESVVDSNLDQLLNKFMQLKISPHSGTAKQADPKLVDVKNVFKSTIIRFAVQQAKLRNKSPSSTPYTVTPVRRSARLSQHVSRTPLRLCDSMRQAATIAPQHVFTPNDNFVHTP